MRVTVVDPRFAFHEGHAQRYMVVFWSPGGDVADEYLLAGEDGGLLPVVEALEWATTNARGRAYQLFVVLDDRSTLLLVGSDPTRHR